VLAAVGDGAVCIAGDCDDSVRFVENSYLRRASSNKLQSYLFRSQHYQPQFRHVMFRNYRKVKFNRCAIASIVLDI
jgi:hypothetical protein